MSSHSTGCRGERQTESTDDRCPGCPRSGPDQEQQEECYRRGYRERMRGNQVRIPPVPRSIELSTTLPPLSVEYLRKRLWPAQVVYRAYGRIDEALTRHLYSV